MSDPVAFGKLYEPKLSKWLVDGLVPEGSITLLTGGRQSGKTILALSFVRGIATGQAFLGNHCERHPVAYFNRYETKSELWQLTTKVTSGILNGLDATQASVYGCWDSDGRIPNIEDAQLEEMVKAGKVLVFDTIPDPKEIDCPEDFLRRARRLAKGGPGLFMFGSTLWNRVQAARNMTDVHFALTKTGDSIVVEHLKLGRKFIVGIPLNQLGGFQMSVSPG